MEFSFKKTKIKISFFFALSMCLFSLFDHSGIILLNLFAASLHESGHFFAMYFCGELPRELHLNPFGMRIERSDSELLSFKKEIFIALAGPAVNILIALASFLCELFFHLPVNLFKNINIIIGLFNLLPCEPLDGAHALKFFLLQKFADEKTEKIITISSVVFLFPVALSGFFVLVNSKYNFSLLLATIYLCSFLIFKKRK